MAESDETESRETEDAPGADPTPQPAEDADEDVSADSEDESDEESQSSTVDEQAGPVADNQPLDDGVKWEDIPVPLLMDRIKTEMGHLAVELIVAKTKAELEYNAKSGVVNVVSKLMERVTVLEEMVASATSGKAAPGRLAKPAKRKSKKGKK